MLISFDVYKSHLLHKHSLTLSTNLLIMVHATTLGHFGGHPAQYIDVNFPEHTGIIINHFLSEKMKNKRTLCIIVKSMELDTLLFSPLAPFCSSFVLLGHTSK